VHRQADDEVSIYSAEGILKRAFPRTGVGLRYGPFISLVSGAEAREAVLDKNLSLRDLKGIPYVDGKWIEMRESGGGLTQPYLVESDVQRPMSLPPGFVFSDNPADLPTERKRAGGIIVIPTGTNLLLGALRGRYKPDGVDMTHPVLWRNGAFAALGTLESKELPGGLGRAKYYLPLRANGKGEIVGVCAGYDPGAHPGLASYLFPVLWRDSKPELLPVSPLARGWMKENFVVTTDEPTIDDRCQVAWTITASQVALSDEVHTSACLWLAGTTIDVQKKLTLDEQVVSFTMCSEGGRAILVTESRGARTVRLITIRARR
jgi:hypothetical protein